MNIDLASAMARVENKTGVEQDWSLALLGLLSWSLPAP
jgi:hypothetical protein